jgi:hypothetical protein
VAIVAQRPWSDCYPRYSQVEVEELKGELSVPYRRGSEEKMGRWLRKTIREGSDDFLEAVIGESLSWSSLLLTMVVFVLLVRWVLVCLTTLSTSR